MHPNVGFGVVLHPVVCGRCRLLAAARGRPLRVVTAARGRRCPRSPLHAVGVARGRRCPRSSRFLPLAVAAVRGCCSRSLPLVVAAVRGRRLSRSSRSLPLAASRAAGGRRCPRSPLPARLLAAARGRPLRVVTAARGRRCPRSPLHAVGVAHGRRCPRSLLAVLAACGHRCPRSPLLAVLAVFAACRFPRSSRSLPLCRLPLPAVLAVLGPLSAVAASRGHAVSATFAQEACGCGAHS
jgi:hypothetical protein